MNFNSLGVVTRNPSYSRKILSFFQLTNNKQQTTTTNGKLAFVSRLRGDVNAGTLMIYNSSRKKAFWGRKTLVIASLRKQPTFLHAATGFPMKWCPNNDYKNPILLTFTTQIWIVLRIGCSRCSLIILQGNQWRRHKMLAVFLKLGDWILWKLSKRW